MQFMLISASCVNVLGLKVKSLGKPLHVNFSLGTRVSVDQICDESKNSFDF